MIKLYMKEIKQEIDNKYSEKIYYTENFNKVNNSFFFEGKNYKFQSVSIRTVQDKQEFVKIIYSLLCDGIEIIQNYTDLENKLMKVLLKEANFPTNNHLIPQHLLKNWTTNNEGIYLSQNNPNGEISYKKAQGVTNFLSEYNVFNRIIENKIYTIETGLFKYIDNNFEKIKNKKILNEEVDNNVYKNIDFKEDTFEVIVNIYKFFAHYLKHNRYETAKYNSRIEKLFLMLMDFEKLGNNQNEIMNYITKNCVTYLEKLFNNQYTMSFVRIKKNNILNFSVGPLWGSHHICEKYGKLIMLPIAPEICILINSKKIKTLKIVKDEKNLNDLLRGSIEQYINMLEVYRSNFLLINGNKNYIECESIFDEKGRYDFIQDYLNYPLQNKNIKDLISEKFDCNKLSFGYRIYSSMKDFEKLGVINLFHIEYENDVAKKILFRINNENIVNSFEFDKRGGIINSSYTNFIIEIL